MPLNQGQGRPTRVRTIVLLVLLALSLVLLTGYAREGSEGPLHAVQDGFMGIAGRTGSVSAGLGQVSDTAAQAAQDATASPETLTGLREQNDELRSLLASAEEYRLEAERLRALLEMKQTVGVNGPTAHIIGRSVNAWDRSFTIDLGTEDGVKGGMSVMGPAGVIGQVAHASAHSSSVRLLTDANSGAAVMVQSSRANGIVRGSINGLLYLEDLEEDQIPEVGDIIVTSGLGGSYERGLPVGTIVSVNKTANDSSGDIIVNPNCDISKLEEVVIVMSVPEQSSADQAQKSGASAQAGANGAAGADGTQQGEGEGYGGVEGSLEESYDGSSWTEGEEAAYDYAG